MKKVFLFLVFLSNTAFSLEVKCNFEEVYSNGDIQNGIFLIKDEKMRYQYFKEDLYTIIYKNNKFFLIHNFDNKIVQKLNQNTEVMKLFSQIIQDYPQIRDNYIKDNININVEKSLIKFIKRISIQSSQLNVSINIVDCIFQPIDNKYFKHFDLVTIN